MTNQLMHGIFAASLCSTWLAILFITTRKIFAIYIGSRWSYYMWFSVFIPWVAIWVPFYFWVIAAVLTIYSLIKPIISSVFIYTPLASKVFFTITNGYKYSLILSKILFILWLTGTLTCLLYIIFRHFQFIKVLRKNSRPMTLDEKEVISESLNSYQRKNISIIYLSKAVTSNVFCLSLFS
jgi:beta-lactamase regulating signal transducer with metallopeptidase domain